MVSELKDLCILIPYLRCDGVDCAPTPTPLSFTRRLTVLRSLVAYSPFTKSGYLSLKSLSYK